MPNYQPERSGEDRRHHCGDHDSYHDIVEKVAINIEWIMKFLKVAGSITATTMVVIVIPTAIWLINLSARVGIIETKLDIHINSSIDKMEVNQIVKRRKL